MIYSTVHDMEFTKKFGLKFFSNIITRTIDFGFIDDTGENISCYTLGTTILYMGEHNTFHLELLWNPYDIELSNKINLPSKRPYIRIELKE